MRIAAVQLSVDLANVFNNVNKIETYIQQAANAGAQLVLFPEFCSSAIGFCPNMLQVAGGNKSIPTLWHRLAKEYNITIGGSLILFDGTHAYNTFLLVFPNGTCYTHKKDIPTQFENCYYTRGDTNHILHTPMGKIGVALCWEMIRWDTVKRLYHQVDFVLAGSCWWDLPVDAPSTREPLRKYNQQLALDTPVTFAKLLGVPVIHANHCGSVTAANFPKKDVIKTRQLVGATQVIAANGDILERRPFTEGEGILFTDVNLQHTKPIGSTAIPNDYWIPPLPSSYLEAWSTINPLGEAYYKEVALPFYQTQNRTANR